MGILNFFGYTRVVHASGDELYTSYTYSYGFGSFVVKHKAKDYPERRTYEQVLKFFGI